MKSSFTGNKVESILKVANGKTSADNSVDATTGKVLTKTDDGVEWSDPTGKVTDVYVGTESVLDENSGIAYIPEAPVQGVKVGGVSVVDSDGIANIPAAGDFTIENVTYAEYLGMKEAGTLKDNTIYLITE